MMGSSSHYNNILTSGDEDRQGVFSQAPRLYIETRVHSPRKKRKRKRKKKGKHLNTLFNITNCPDMTRRRERIIPLHISKEVDPLTNRFQFFNAYDVMLKSPERQSFSCPSSQIADFRFHIYRACAFASTERSTVCTSAIDPAWRIDALMHDICYAGEK